MLLVLGAARVLVALVLVVYLIGAYAPPFPGLILSPSAALRVAGLGQA